MSKKNTNNICTDTVYTILNLFRDGLTTPAEIMDQYDITKQDLNYWLQKLDDIGLIKKLSHGIYQITQSGKKIHDEYEHYKSKQMIRLENMRLSFRVVSNENNIVTKMHWEKNYSLRNNVKVYQTHYQGQFIRLIKSKITRLEITCEKGLGTDVNTLFLDASVNIVNLANNIAKKYDIEISEYPILTTKPEFAIPHPFADALLQVMGASQITTDKGKMNKSKGRMADFEPMDIHYAQKIVDIPNTLDDMNNNINKLHSKVENIQCFFSGYGLFSF